MYEEYRLKKSVVIVFTGDGKGKTSASLGLMARALGTGLRVAYIQFIKNWPVGEHQFIDDIKTTFKRRLLFHRGGKGFFRAGPLSTKGVTTTQHRKATEQSYSKAYRATTSGKFDVVICDELSNAIHDGLLGKDKLKKLLQDRHQLTSLCITGRNFPKDLLRYVDIATDMTKIKHHYDEKFLANKGIDY